MSFELFETMSRILTPGIISEVAGRIGESSANTEKAAQATVASLAGLACNRAATTAGSNNILSLISASKLDHGISTNFGSLLKSEGGITRILETGAGLLRPLLGSSTSDVASAIASGSGIKPSSASYLLNFLSPLVFATLGKEVQSSGLSGTGLSSLLSSHRDTIQRFAPAELAPALGVDKMANLCGAPAPVQRPIAMPVVEPRGRARWLWALPLALLAVAIPTYRSCSTTTLASVKLPCGTILTVQRGTVNHTLATFLLAGSDADLPKRIVFDHLNFDFGSSQLAEDSKPTVRDLTAILNCYPNLQIEMDGYTDSIGDPAANKALSLDRATTVKNMLVQAGIDGGRISVGGWGEEKPLASNNTEEGRAKNRRTELVIVKTK